MAQVIVLLGIGLILYFLPTIIAHRRQNPDRMAIGVINTFLGWTFLGWVIALAWACRGNLPTAID
jgi:cytochrome c biogenesis protein CcdA